MSKNLHTSKWCSISNLGNNEYEIDITGDIGGDQWATFGEDSTGNNNTKELLSTELKTIAELDAAKITVNIDSLGGDVAHGISMFQILQNSNAQITTRVLGMTASAATILAQAGQKRQIQNNSLYLVHNIISGTFGTLNDLIDDVDNFKKINIQLAEIYASRSGKQIEEIQEVMNRKNGNGEWLTAQEAVDFGFADEVIQPVKAAAHISPKLLTSRGLPQIPQNKLIHKNTNPMEIFKKRFETLLNKVGYVKPTNQEEEEEAETTTEAGEMVEMTQAQFDELEAKMLEVLTIKETETEEAEEAVEAITKEKEEAEAEAETAKAELKKATAEIARLKGKSIEVAPNNDPAPTKRNSAKNINPALQAAFGDITSRDRRLFTNKY